MSYYSAEEFRLMEVAEELEETIRVERSERERAQAQRAEEARAAEQAAAEAERRARYQVGDEATSTERSVAFGELLRQRREDAFSDDNGRPWRYQPQASPWGS